MRGRRGDRGIGMPIKRVQPTRARGGGFDEDGVFDWRGGWRAGRYARQEITEGEKHVKVVCIIGYRDGCRCN